ncbi:MAG TPA: aspartate-semialdehyde dehydrogenase [Clostridiales bacterium]|nr:aspartate-semialdehyde dehydrogenase [Clostridiales bacterium]
MGIKLGILGATGAVGEEMLKVLAERNFPVEQLRLLASAKSAGQIINWQERAYVVEEVSEKSFKGLDILLVAVGNEISKKFSPIAVEQGVVVIDNSSAYRLDDDVPLVIPEVNPDDVRNHKGIIANPNCSTIIALTAINELNNYSKVVRMTVSTYQAVSGAGLEGIRELDDQIRQTMQGNNTVVSTFQYQIAYNLIPHIGAFTDNGYSEEEMKMQNEGAKILHNPDLKVNCTCVRVPVYRSHSESITIETENEISVEKAKSLLKNAKGVKLVDDLENNIYPMPLDSSNQDLIYVGRIRKDISRDRSLALRCCGDQVRKGAATNAVQIAELLVEFNLV